LAGKITPDQDYERGTALARLTATFFLVRFENGGNDGSETFAGFLVQRIRPSFSGQFEVADLLSRDGEVFKDRSSLHLYALTPV